MLSVITATVRPKGLALVYKALKQQFLQKFQWIIASPFNPGIQGVVWIKDRPKKKGEYWTVYTAYNRAIRHADELVISWQDYTYARPDTLDRFFIHYRQEPKTIIGAVGNKYTDPTWTVETWRDPRVTGRGYYECNFNEIELNLCSIPKAAITGVGGFDEKLNKYSSLCGLDVLDRINIKGGYKFKIDESIKSYSLEHGRLPDWEKHNPLNGIYQCHRLSYIANPVLNWLQS